MRRKILSILVIAATAVTALLVVATPAQADFKRVCFGYTGNFRSGSNLEFADWNSDNVVDECFGIAPDRTIWHAWPNSGGWRQMPNAGRADALLGSFRGKVGKHYAHNVVVRVYGGADYYSWHWEDYDGWYGWYECTPSACT